jgi:hypothetical protein
MSEPITGRGWVLSAGAALLARPDLWRTSARVVRMHTPQGWWKQRPFLPVPDRAWMGFRYETAFAATDGRPNPEQFIEYLEWSKSWRYLG